ncbi:TetR/AcrR family transcriptional regulator [Nonomuraea jabiensis]|uniref:TetR/AcrR family transcriptional regulator n=1 Tax=Nonomuraea jabiensis TaxID=882448 RepID=UPI003D727B97
MVRLTRAQQQERTRAAVLAAAREEFAERGYADAKVDRIAERAELTRGAVYSNFPGKRALYLAVLIDSIGSAAAEEGPPPSGVAEALGAFARVWLERLPLTGDTAAGGKLQSRSLSGVFDDEPGRTALGQLARLEALLLALALEPYARSHAVEPHAPSHAVEPHAPSHGLEPHAPSQTLEPGAPTHARSHALEPHAPSQALEPGARSHALESHTRSQALEPGAASLALEPGAPSQALEPHARNHALEPGAPSRALEPHARNHALEPGVPSHVRRVRLAELVLTLLDGAAHLAETAPGFGDPFDVARACRHLADLDLADTWDPPHLPFVTPARVVRDAWEPPAELPDELTGRRARLDADGVIAVLGTGRLEAAEEAVRAARPGDRITIAVVTGDPAELGRLVRLRLGDLAGSLRRVFGPDPRPGLHVVLDEHAAVASAAGIPDADDATEAAVRVQAGEIVARAHGRGAAHAAAITRPTLPHTGP